MVVIFDTHGGAAFNQLFGGRFMMKKSIDLGFYGNVLNGGGACDRLAITTHNDNLICVLLQV